MSCLRYSKLLTNLARSSQGVSIARTYTMQSEGGDPRNSNMVVKHNKPHQQFEISLPELSRDAMALLQYTEPVSGVLDLWHTEVPDALQRRGIAKLLAKEAFTYVVETDIKMILSCTYLQKYYNDNPLPEYTQRIIKH